MEFANDGNSWAISPVLRPHQPGIWLRQAIRLFDLDQFPGFVISHTPRGRKWFTRAPSVPRHWFPREDLDAKSSAFGNQFGGRPDDGSPRKIGADAWFDRQGAARFMVREQTVRVARDETLSLVVLDDKGMLDGP